MPVHHCEAQHVACASSFLLCVQSDFTWTPHFPSFNKEHHYGKEWQIEPPGSRRPNGPCESRDLGEQTQNGTRHNVTFSRLYKDGDEWKDSSSFGREDLPLLTKVADRAHAWIYDQAQKANGSEEPF